MTSCAISRDYAAHLNLRNYIEEGLGHRDWGYPKWAHAGAPPSDIDSRPHRACKASREAIISQEPSCGCLVSERPCLHAAFTMLVFSN